MESNVIPITYYLEKDIITLAEQALAEAHIEDYTRFIRLLKKVQVQYGRQFDE